MRAPTPIRKPVSRGRIVMAALAAVVLVGASGILFSHLVLRQFGMLIDRSITPVFEAANAMEQAIVHNRDVYKYLAEDDPAIRENIARQLHEAAEGFSREFAEVRWAKNEAGHQALQKLWTDYLTESVEVLRLSDEGSRAEAVDRMLATARPLFRELRETLSATMRADHEEALRSFEKTEGFFVWAGFGTAGFVGTFALAVAALSYQRRRYERTARRNLELLTTLEERDSLYSVIAHDLRSPFTPVLGFLEELSNSELNSERAEMIRIVQASASDYFEILEDLLIWAQDQRGNLIVQSQSIGLHAAVTEASELLRRSASAKDIRIDHQVAPHLMVETDPRMLASILRNLIANALKYSKPGSRVMVESGNPGTRHVALMIRDSGNGMSADKVREVLSQEPASSERGTENEKGHGLGLYLTRLFVQKIGGSLRCDSSVGTGTVFTLSLPTK